MDKENPRNSPAFPRIETHRKEINHEELTQILILMFRLGCIFRTLGLNLIFYKQISHKHPLTGSHAFPSGWDWNVNLIGHEDSLMLWWAAPLVTASRHQRALPPQFRWGQEQDSATFSSKSVLSTLSTKTLNALDVFLRIYLYIWYFWYNK